MSRLSGKIRTQLAVLTSLVCMSQKKYTMYILHLQLTEEKGLKRIQWGLREDSLASISSSFWSKLDCHYCFVRFSNGDQNRSNRKIRNCSPFEFCIKQYRNSQHKWIPETLGALLLRNPGDSLSQSIRLHKNTGISQKVQNTKSMFCLVSIQNKHYKCALQLISVPIKVCKSRATEASDSEYEWYHTTGILFFWTRLFSSYSKKAFLRIRSLFESFAW